MAQGAGTANSSFTMILAEFQRGAEFELNHPLGDAESLGQRLVTDAAETHRQQNCPLAPGHPLQDRVEPFDFETAFETAILARRLVRQIGNLGQIIPAGAPRIVTQAVETDIKGGLIEIGPGVVDPPRHILAFKAKIGFVEGLAGEIVGSQPLCQPPPQVIVAISEKLAQA